MVAMAMPTTCPVYWLTNGDPLMPPGYTEPSISTHTAVALTDCTVPAGTGGAPVLSPSPLNSDTRSPGWGAPRGSGVNTSDASTGESGRNSTKSTVRSSPVRGTPGEPYSVSNVAR